MTDVRFTLGADPLAAGIVLAAGLAVGVWAWRRLPRQARGARTLFLLDAAFAAGLAAWVLRPGLAWRDVRREPPAAWILTDLSRSCRDHAGLAALRAEVETGDLAARLAARGFAVRRAAFGAAWAEGRPAADDVFAADSRFAAAYEAHVDAAAVFLVGDGRGDGPPAAPAAAGTRRPPVFPLLPVRDGVDAPDDAITGLAARPAALGRETAVEAVVRAAGGGRLVELLVDGRRAGLRAVPAGTSRALFAWRPDGTGEAVLTARFADDRRDPYPPNDTRSAVVEVGEAGVRVLLAWGVPDPEFAFLRRLAAGLARYEVAAHGAGETDALVAAARGARVIAVVRAGSGRFAAPAVTAIGAAVRGGAALVWVQGEGGETDPAFAPLLPYHALVPRLERGGFAWRETDVGRTSGMAFRLDEAARALVPPLEYRLPARPAAGAAVLATADGVPVLLSGRAGAGRVFALLAGPTWKWDFANLGFGLRTDVHARFWGLALEELARGGETWRVECSAREVFPGQPVSIDAFLPGDGRATAAVALVDCLADASATATPAADAPRFALAARGGGRFGGFIRAARFGAWRILVETGSGWRDSGRRLVVRAAAREDEGGLDRAALAALAARTGGRCLGAGERLPDGLAGVPATRVVDGAALPLETGPGVAVWLATFLAAIWLRWRRWR